jgi:hypothetical protein
VCCRTVLSIRTLRIQVSCIFRRAARLRQDLQNVLERNWIPAKVNTRCESATHHLTSFYAFDRQPGPSEPCLRVFPRTNSVKTISPGQRQRIPRPSQSSRLSCRTMLVIYRQDPRPYCGCKWVLATSLTPILMIGPKQSTIAAARSLT